MNLSDAIGNADSAKMSPRTCQEPSKLLVPWGSLHFGPQGPFGRDDVGSQGDGFFLGTRLPHPPLVVSSEAL